MHPRLDRRHRHVQHVPDLLQRERLQVAQHHDRLVLAERLDRLVNDSLRIREEQLALRRPVVAWYHRITVQPFVLARFRVQRIHRFAFAQLVDAQVRRNPIDPGGKFHRRVVIVPSSYIHAGKLPVRRLPRLDGCTASGTPYGKACPDRAPLISSKSSLIALQSQSR